MSSIRIAKDHVLLIGCFLFTVSTLRAEPFDCQRHGYGADLKELSAYAHRDPGLTQPGHTFFLDLCVEIAPNGNQAIKTKIQSPLEQQAAADEKSCPIRMFVAKSDKALSLFKIAEANIYLLTAQSIKNTEEAKNRPLVSQAEQSVGLDSGIKADGALEQSTIRLHQLEDVVGLLKQKLDGLKSGRRTRNPTPDWLYKGADFEFVDCAK